MAAAAETQRVKVKAGAVVDRTIYLAVAGVFGIAAFAMLHVALFALFSRVGGPAWGPFWGAVIVLLLDLVLAGILYLMSTRTGRQPAVIEARTVRDVALAGATEELLTGVAKRGAPWAAFGGLLFAFLRSRR